MHKTGMAAENSLGAPAKAFISYKGLFKMSFVTADKYSIQDHKPTSADQLLKVSHATCS